MEKTLEIRGLTKTFGPFAVLKGIDLDLSAGEVTVLMGANGAGKSTLVRIISGVIPASGGTLALNGKPFAPGSAADAINSGILTVHQLIDDGVIPDLDVANNLLLDQLAQPGAGHFVDDRKMRRDAEALAETIGLRIDVRRRVADLGVADRQMIAIARAMAKSPKVLILDEPTSSLSAAEAESLFRLVDRLKAQGVAILYISHRMSDIRRIADRIVSMRDGVISGVFDGDNLDLDGAVTAMLGQAMKAPDLTTRAGSEPILEIDGVTLRPGAAPLSLTAYRGEVVVITGLLGSGKSRLADFVFGLAQPDTGAMRLKGQPYAPANAQQAVQGGVFMCPKDRGNNSVIPSFDITNNMSLPFLGAFSNLGFLKGRRQRAEVAQMVYEIGVVCRSANDPITTLSGGNQQKVMIARWLMQPCDVLVLDEPFQGVDIGARHDIGHHIRASASNRTTLVLVAELDEAIELADRIVVLHEGEIAREFDNDNVDMSMLIAAATGSGSPESQVAGGVA